MPSLARSILLAALYFVVLPGGPFAPIQALASPTPVMAADYSHSNTTAARTSTIKNSRAKHSFAHNHTRPYPMASPVVGRDVDGFELLTSYYTNADRHATNLKGLAARSASVSDHDFDFHHACAYELTGFQTNLLGFQSKLDADKGLAYYDRSDDLETLLKNLVNLNKNVLSCIDILVYNIPVLGPLLGPIVYEIKCILDRLLNFCENLTDAVVNLLVPVLRPIIDVLIQKACQGLCL